ncbi:MAG: hypothetical protein A3G35_20380 [candidate division NC10 bacterium RIFCSPLOWO2_12_FULL_66_18]|nr:MAG: hypothetical protein A3H39_10775 [candidate division NC10 bacterium RIFCSPLOWO2_02_FULL_66_22]OGB96330.1 MAG: hypothetical protein A3G35_20380 [candidate division NC10 bacterium RIFCSPLOWO2_12_FULL_66_18]
MLYLNKFFGVYDYTIELTITVLFSIMIVIISGQVVFRYLFKIPMMWSAEMAQYIFIWIVYLGGAQAFLMNRHLVVDMFSRKIPDPYWKYLTLILYLMILIFLFFVFWLGLQYVGQNLYKPIFSVRWIRLGWVYASVPVGALFMVINILRVVLPSILAGKNSRIIEETRVDPTSVLRA